MTLKEKLAHQKRVDHIKNEILNYQVSVDKKDSFSFYAIKRIGSLQKELAKITKE